MSDDYKSASQLQHEYMKGGSLQDSDLNASQLRARHGIKSNNKGTLKNIYTALNYLPGFKNFCDLLVQLILESIYFIFLITIFVIYNNRFLHSSAY